MKKFSVRGFGFFAFFVLCLNTASFSSSLPIPQPFLMFTGAKALNTLLSVEVFKNTATAIYDSAHLGEVGLDSDVFLKGLTGFYNLKALGKVPEYARVLTIIDFTRSSSYKRMWIIDLRSRQLLLQTWVAHGEGSGMDVAGSFSNELSSYQSSLGFYLTNAVYAGKHGRSLKLVGVDEGFNDRAYARKIVIHAAKYVSERWIRKNGHLGRSQGCPAVSPHVITEVINLLKGNSVMFINGNEPHYISKYLDMESAADVAVNEAAFSGSFNTWSESR